MLLFTGGEAIDWLFLFATVESVATDYIWFCIEEKIVEGRLLFLDDLPALMPPDCLT